MVQDKITGARGDFGVSPVKERTVSLSYYLSTAVNALIISFVATLIGFVYLAVTGWYLSAADVFCLFLDVILLVLFGTALSSLVCYPLTSQGQLSAVGTIVSAGYGFLCGAYMPISSFSEGLRNTLSLLPGTYGTSLVRNHALQGVFREMVEQGIPDAAVTAVKDVADCNFYFFGNKVEVWQCYLVLALSIVVCVAAYLLITKLAGRKRK